MPLELYLNQPIIQTSKELIPRKFELKRDKEERLYFTKEVPSERQLGQIITHLRSLKVPAVWRFLFPNGQEASSFYKLQNRRHSITGEALVHYLNQMDPGYEIVEADMSQKRVKLVPTNEGPAQARWYQLQDDRLVDELKERPSLSTHVQLDMMTAGLWNYLQVTRSLANPELLWDIILKYVAHLGVTLTQGMKEEPLFTIADHNYETSKILLQFRNSDEPEPMQLSKDGKLVYSQTGYPFSDHLPDRIVYEQRLELQRAMESIGIQSITSDSAPSQELKQEPLLETLDFGLSTVERNSPSILSKDTGFIAGAGLVGGLNLASCIKVVIH